MTVFPLFFQLYGGCHCAFVCSPPESCISSSLFQWPEKADICADGEVFLGLESHEEHDGDQPELRAVNYHVYSSRMAHWFFLFRGISAFLCISWSHSLYETWVAWWFVHYWSCLPIVMSSLVYIPVHSSVLLLSYFKHMVSTHSIVKIYPCVHTDPYWHSRDIMCIPSLKL